MNTPQLPNNWAWCKLDDLSQKITQGPNPEYDLNVDSSFRVVKTKDFYDDKILYEKADKISSKVFAEFEGYKLLDGDILVGLVGVGSTGKCNIFKRQNNVEYILTRATGLIRLINKDLTLPEYLHYFLISHHGKKVLESITGGSTGQLVIKTSLLKVFPIPLAPANEQKRIVSKIEELFSFLDAGKETLHKVQAQLKRYRQAVLKYALEGKLTIEWRKNHRNIMKNAPAFLNQFQIEVSLSDRINQLKLPEEWAWATLEQLSANIVDCLHSTAKFTETGKFCIDTTCIEKNKILFEKARHVSEETFRERIRRLVPMEGDVFFAREGTIGTAVVVPPNLDLCLGQRMMMFRLRKGIVPLYFTWGLLSPTFEKQWKPKVMGTTAPHVNIKDLRKMALPITCPEEQEAIVNEVETQFSVIYYTERTVTSNLNQIDLLRQSILKNAFEGKLVPQNPADEPAEKLLDRLKFVNLSDKKIKIANKPELSNYVK